MTPIAPHPNTWEILFLSPKHVDTLAAENIIFLRIYHSTQKMSKVYPPVILVYKPSGRYKLSQAGFELLSASTHISSQPVQ